MRRLVLAVTILAMSAPAFARDYRHYPGYRGPSYDHHRFYQPPRYHRGNGAAAAGAIAGMAILGLMAGAAIAAQRERDYEYYEEPEYRYREWRRRNSPQYRYEEPYVIPAPR